uniref:Uncharacterized protein n=1 Tax=Spironucleus salmonicida TaxID=348837 RepID=V6LT11_9EUKA|eukprot:EST46831.1 hypothetical protein SS50377_13161 [Spironucleus salmonicida]
MFQSHNFRNVKQLFKQLTSSEAADPVYTGFLSNSAGYAFCLIEAPHDNLIDFLRQLQVHTARSETLVPHHALLTSQKFQTSHLLSQPKIFTFLEDVAQLCPRFECFTARLPQNEADYKPAEAACFVSVSAHKMAVVMNLAIVDDLIIEDKINEMGDELPCFSYFERFCGIADLGEKGEKGTGKLSFCEIPAELKAQFDQLREDMREQKEGGEIDQIYDLDQFIIELVNNDSVKLFEDESANLNESWLYDNLKHILGL